MVAEVTYKSDLTHKKIANEGEHAYLIVHSHPAIDTPVKLDAHVFEAANLKDKVVGVVRVEVIVPDDQPEMLDIPVDSFNAIFGKDIVVDDVLGSAEPAYEAAPVVRRRGRPAGSTNKPIAKPTGSGYSKETLAAIREWASSKGITVAARGRIKQSIIDEWEAEHKAAD